MAPNGIDGSLWGGIWEFQSTQQAAFRQFQTKMSMKPKGFLYSPFRFPPFQSTLQLDEAPDFTPGTWTDPSFKLLMTWTRFWGVSMSFVMPAGCFFFRVKRAPPTLEPWDYSTVGPTLAPDGHGGCDAGCWKRWNKEIATGNWSFFRQVGTPWATGMWGVAPVFARHFCIPALVLCHDETWCLGRCFWPLLCHVFHHDLWKLCCWFNARGWWCRGISCHGSLHQAPSRGRTWFFTHDPIYWNDLSQLLNSLFQATVVPFLAHPMVSTEFSSWSPFRFWDTYE